MNKQTGVYEITGDMVFYDIFEGDKNPRFPFLVSVYARSSEEAVRLLREAVDAAERPDKMGYIGAEISRITLNVPGNIYSGLTEDTGRTLVQPVCRRSARMKRKDR